MNHATFQLSQQRDENVSEEELNELDADRYEQEETADSSLSSIVHILSQVRGNHASTEEIVQEMKRNEEKDTRMVDGRSDSNTSFYSYGIHDQVRNMIKTSTRSRRKSLGWSHGSRTNSALSDSDTFSELLCQVLEIRESSSGTSIEDDTMYLDNIMEESRSDLTTFTYSSGVREEPEYNRPFSKMKSEKLLRPAVSSPAKNRLIRDFNKLQCHPPNGILAAPIDGNIMRWQGVIFGHDGTPWEGGIFKLNLNFTDNYPFKPPVVHFLTEMFHPNIGVNGNICFDMLGKCWTPAYDVVDVLKSIQSLLSKPSSVGYNSEASTLLSQNRLEYNRRVREIVRKSLAQESRRHSV